jgi:hypothetical protein
MGLKVPHRTKIAKTAEPVAVLALISSVIRLVGFGTKLVERLDEFALAEMSCQYYASRSNRNYTLITNTASVSARLLS